MSQVIHSGKDVSLSSIVSASSSPALQFNLRGLRKDCSSSCLDYSRSITSSVQSGLDILLRNQFLKIMDHRMFTVVQKISDPRYFLRKLLASSDSTLKKTTRTAVITDIYTKTKNMFFLNRFEANDYVKRVVYVTTKNERLTHWTDHPADRQRLNKVKMTRCSIRQRYES